MNDRGFLSHDITVTDLIKVKSDAHHIFPREYLKSSALPRGQYNQITNYVVAQSEITIAIGKKEPKVYFTQRSEQCDGSPKRYGNIIDAKELKDNFRMNCIHSGIETMSVDDYPALLAERRRLMAQ